MGLKKRGWRVGEARERAVGIGKLVTGFCAPVRRVVGVVTNQTNQAAWTMGAATGMTGATTGTLMAVSLACFTRDLMA